MYVITKMSGIINLDCYPRVDVFTKNNIHLLCAFSRLDARAVPQDGIVIAEFDNRADADYTFRNLCEVIAANRSTWNVSTVELLSDFWTQVKAELPSDIIPPSLLEELKLRVTDLNEIAVIYPSAFDSKTGTYISDNEKAKVENKLIEVLNAQSSMETEWKVKWESSDLSE